MQNRKKNTFFKIISVIVLIQGVLQLLNLLGLVMMYNEKPATSLFRFYLGIILVGAYAIAAIIGGYTGLKNGDTRDGCRRCFYLSIVLVFVNVATIILNIVFKAFAITQFEALIVPVIFMIFTILCGRNNE